MILSSSYFSELSTKSEVTLFVTRLQHPKFSTEFFFQFLLNLLRIYLFSLCIFFVGHPFIFEAFFLVRLFHVIIFFYFFLLFVSFNQCHIFCLGPFL